MIQALAPRFDVEIFSEHTLSAELLSRVDMVAFPGGIGDSDSYWQFFGRKRGNLIADFVERGGKYLGICMGAYWADSWYFDLLDHVRAVQYIKRPKTDIRRSYGTVAPVRWHGQSTMMYFYDGCTFVGNGHFDTVATYANGDPMAIIQGNLGLIGCHPESQEFWYTREHPYLRDHWHRGAHHTLLLNFALRLMRDPVIIPYVATGPVCVESPQQVSAHSLVHLP